MAQTDTRPNKQQPWQWWHDEEVRQKGITQQTPHDQANKQLVIVSERIVRDSIVSFSKRLANSFIQCTMSEPWCSSFILQARSSQQQSVTLVVVAIFIIHTWLSSPPHYFSTSSQRSNDESNMLARQGKRDSIGHRMKSGRSTIVS